MHSLILIASDVLSCQEHTCNTWNFQGKLLRRNGRIVGVHVDSKNMSLRDFVAYAEVHCPPTTHHFVHASSVCSGHVNSCVLSCCTTPPPCIMPNPPAETSMCNPPRTLVSSFLHFLILRVKLHVAAVTGFRPLASLADCNVSDMTGGRAMHADAQRESAMPVRALGGLLPPMHQQSDATWCPSSREAHPCAGASAVWQL
jgi:hypothetical protein